MKKYGIILICLSILIALCISVNAEDVLLMEDLCESEKEGCALTEGSVDGTKYYHIEGGIDLGYLPYETSADFLYELDIRFNNEGCGFSFMKKGKWNSCIRIKDGQLALQTGSNNFTKLTGIDMTKWYHVTFLGRTNKDANAVTYGHIILEEYNNGERVNRQVFENVNLRNNAATHFINAFGCDIDNIKAYTPAPTKITLSADGDKVVAGGVVQYTVAAWWNDLEMRGINTADITFEVLDENMQYVIEDENIVIDNGGLLRTEVLTPGQKVNVRVSSKVAGLQATCKLEIVSKDVFTLKGVGINEARNKITEISAVKNFGAYKDQVTFVVGFYDAQGNMLAIDYKSMNGEGLTEGENKIAMNTAVPTGFDFAKDKINLFVVTSMTGSIKEDAVIVKANELPEFNGGVTVVAIKPGCDIAKVNKEDILYFNVIYPEKEALVIPQSGDVYLMGSINGIDTLVKITK